MCLGLANGGKQPAEIKDKANDILDKLDFFNQRAARELWGDKPIDVQNQDIADFSSNIRFLKGFINRQQAAIDMLNAENTLAISERNAFQKSFYKTVKENQLLKAENEKLKIQVYHLKKYDEKRDIELHLRLIATARAEAIKEFADKLKDVFVTIDGTFECCEIEDYIDNLLKEMAGADNGKE